MRTETMIPIEPIPIDDDTLPLLVLMVIGTTEPGRWDDVSLSRLFDVKPSQAKAVLDDLADWGMIYSSGLMGYTISGRGFDNLRIYLPGGTLPKA